MLTTENPAPTWHLLAACRAPGIDRSIFFPHYKMGPSSSTVRKAKRICGGCRVRAECLDYGFTIGCVDGIYGGMTPEERGVR